MRQGGPQFSVDHGATEREECSDEPQEENQRWIAQVPRHETRRGEDASTDDVAHEHTGGCEPANLLCGGFLSRFVDHGSLMASCSVLPYHTERCLGSEANRFVMARFPHLALPLEAPLEYGFRSIGPQR